MIRNIFKRHYKLNPPKIKYDPNLYTPMQIALGRPEKALKKLEK